VNISRKISRLVGSSQKSKGVAEILVKIPKARGKRIEAFILVTSYEAGALASLIA
jgi:hypothetical protein